MNGDNTITTTQFRDSLNKFWDKALAVESNGDDLLFTMPSSYPDGWQIVLEISKKTPKGFRLSDRGKTLSWLSGQGQNIHTDTVQRHIERICSECHMEESNGVFSRWLEAPIKPVDIHVFTEGIVAVSHLHILNEHRVIEENVAETTVKRILHDTSLSAQRNHRLSITKERKIKVDFYVEQRSPVALQLIKTKSDLSGTMEKWGFRWHELKKAYDGLRPVMLYDRNTQSVDSYSRHIGNTECELFCGYDETDRIHEVLASAQ